MLVRLARALTCFCVGRLPMPKRLTSIVRAFSLGKNC